MDTINKANDTVANETIDGTDDNDTINKATDTDVNETIDGTDGGYRWTKYYSMNVIEDTSNGYINATKMCAMSGKTKNGSKKNFRDWRVANSTLIDYIATDIVSAGGHTTELLYSIINGLDSIKGSYVHSELLPYIAEWCGVDIHNNDIVQKCQLVKNKLKRQKIAKTGTDVLALWSKCVQNRVH